MPIQHAIWKVGSKPEPLIVSKPTTEKKLEDMIVEWRLALRAGQRGLERRAIFSQPEP